MLVCAIVSGAVYLGVFLLLVFLGWLGFASIGWAVKSKRGAGPYGRKTYSALSVGAFLLCFCVLGLFARSLSPRSADALLTYNFPEVDQGMVTQLEGFGNSGCEWYEEELLFIIPTNFVSKIIQGGEFIASNDPRFREAMGKIPEHQHYKMSSASLLPPDVGGWDLYCFSDDCSRTEAFGGYRYLFVNQQTGECYFYSFFVS